MGANSDFGISIEDLNTVLGAMDDAYPCPPKKYHPPKGGPGAMTKEYLMGSPPKNGNVLKVPLAAQGDYTGHHCMAAGGLPPKLDTSPKDHNPPPSGCDPPHQPDHQWVFDVIAWVDGGNELKIPQNSTISLNALKRTVGSGWVPISPPHPHPPQQVLGYPTILLFLWA